MTDSALVERWMRDANPIPVLDDVDAEELARAVAAVATRRAAAIDAPTQRPGPAQPTPAMPPQRQRRRKAWAFAAAFVLVLVAVGLAAFVLARDTAPFAGQPTPPASTPAPIDLTTATLLADAWIAGWNTADPDAVASVFTDDGIYDDGGYLGGDPVHGRDAIVEYATGGNSSMMAPERTSAPTAISATTFHFEMDFYYREMMSGALKKTHAMVAIELAGQRARRIEIVDMVGAGMGNDDPVTIATEIVDSLSWDPGDADKTAALFTEDGVYVHPSGSVRGREEIREHSASGAGGAAPAPERIGGMVLTDAGTYIFPIRGSMSGHPVSEIEVTLDGGLVARLEVRDGGG